MNSSLLEDVAHSLVHIKRKCRGMVITSKIRWKATRPMFKLLIESFIKKCSQILFIRYKVISNPFPTYLFALRKIFRSSNLEKSLKNQMKQRGFPRIAVWNNKFAFWFVSNDIIERTLPANEFISRRVEKNCKRSRVFHIETIFLLNKLSLSLMVSYSLNHYSRKLVWTLNEYFLHVSLKAETLVKSSGKKLLHLKVTGAKRKALA